MVKNKLAISLIISGVLTSFAIGADSLGDIVVTAKSNTQVIDTAGSFNIITKDDIKKMQASSINEILEEVVGVSVGVNDNSINGRQSISIRGTKSRHTLILIDGKRVSGSDAQIGHSDFQYSWLPIESIEKVEVVRGPMSSLYGSQAIGGVINIITKKPEGKIFGSIDVELGANNSNGGEEKDISLVLGGQVTDKLSMSVFAQKKDITVVKGKENENETEREGKELTNVMLNLWYDIDNTQQLSASLIKGDEIRETLDYDEFYDIDKIHYSFGYKKNFEDVTMDIKYYSTQNDSHTDQFEYTHKMQDDVLNTEFSIDKFDNHFVIAGAEYRKENYRKKYDDSADDATKGFDDNIKYKSAYVQDEINLSDSFLLTLGARYDHHERFGGEISPKAYLVYKLSENSRIKGGYGHGFNAPTLTQNSDDYEVAIPVAFHPMFGFPTEFNRFNGNSELKPEISDTVELGYEHNNDSQVFKTTVFYTKVKDLIEPLDTGDTIVGTMTFHEKDYSNVSKSNMYGLELEYSHNDLVSNLDLDFGYTYLKTEDESTGKELRARPKHNANLRLSYDMPYGVDSSVRVNYVGTQIGDSDKKLDDYITVGIQISKEVINDLELRVGVENLTDKRLDDDHNYQLKGRLLYVGMNYKF